MGDGSGGVDVRSQLAALLGKPLARIGRIRKTDETPARISVIDVAALITGKNHHAASKDLRRMNERYPDVSPNWTDFPFPGQGQRKTPVTDVQGIVEIVFLLPGQMAARVRRQALTSRPRRGNNLLTLETRQGRGELCFHFPQRQQFVDSGKTRGKGETVGQIVVRVFCTSYLLA